MTKATWDWESRIGRRVRLRDLHILSAVVRLGSMGKAASHLAMSQSAVSESIANLEHALQVRLLDRGPQGIEPTIYANALLKRGNVVFDELRQGIKDIEFLADPTVGEVQISSPEVLSAWLLPATIEKLSRRHPQVSVRVFQQDANVLEFRALHDRNVDLVINRLPKEFAYDDLHVEVLFEDHHRVVAGERSRFANRRNITLAELAGETWALPFNPAVISIVQEAFEAQGLKAPTSRVTADSVLLRIELLASGRFLSVLPESVLRSVAGRVSFRVLPVKLRVKSPPIVMVRLKNRTVSPAVDLFIDHLRVVAKSKAAGRDS